MKDLVRILEHASSLFGKEPAALAEMNRMPYVYRDQCIMLSAMCGLTGRDPADVARQLGMRPGYVRQALIQAESLVMGWPTYAAKSEKLEALVLTDPVVRSRLASVHALIQRDDLPLGFLAETGRAA